MSRFDHIGGYASVTGRCRLNSSVTGASSMLLLVHAIIQHLSTAPKSHVPSMSVSPLQSVLTTQRACARMHSCATVQLETSGGTPPLPVVSVARLAGCPHSSAAASAQCSHGRQTAPKAAALRCHSPTSASVCASAALATRTPHARQCGCLSRPSGPRARGRW